MHRRFSILVDRRKNNESQGECNEMIVFEPGEANRIPEGHVPEIGFENIRRCLLPGQGGQHIVATDGLCGQLMTFMFFVEARDEMRCYLVWNGQSMRFHGKHMTQILPDLFVDSEENARFLQKKEAADLENGFDGVMEDKPFHEFCLAMQNFESGLDARRRPVPEGVASDVCRAKPMEMQNFVIDTDLTSNITTDLTIFKEIHVGDQCNGYNIVDCLAEHRIGAVMQYYDELMKKAGDSVSEQRTARQLVIDFCDAVYPKADALSDYIDFTRFHRGSASLRRFAARWRLQCAGVSLCGFATRHLRERGDGAKLSAETRPVRHATVDRLDALHCTVLHLTELGLRAKDEDEADADSDGDEKSHTVQDKLHVARFDGTKNTKFNIGAAATVSKGRGVFSLSLRL